MQWDLVCSRKGMSKATATVFFIGVMFGAPLFGFLSDRWVGSWANPKADTHQKHAKKVQLTTVKAGPDHFAIGVILKYKLYYLL